MQHYCGWQPSADAIDALKAEGAWNNDWDASLELLRRHGAELPDRAALIDVFSGFYFGGDPEGDPSQWTGFIGDEPLLVDASFFATLSERKLRCVLAHQAELDALAAAKVQEEKRWAASAWSSSLNAVHMNERSHMKHCLSWQLPDELPGVASIDEAKDIDMDAPPAAAAPMAALVAHMPLQAQVGAVAAAYSMPPQWHLIQAPCRMAHQPHLAQAHVGWQQQIPSSPMISA